MKNKEEFPKTRVMDADRLFSEEIGDFGWFQVKNMAQCLLALIFSAIVSSEYVFTTARIGTRCFIPECESADSMDFMPSWVALAIPSSGTSLDNCRRFRNSSNTIPLDPSNDTCPATLFNTSSMQLCDEYIYENTDTVVYEFGMACDEWRRAMLGSVRNLAMIVSLPLTGLLSDRWGRRNALALNALCAAVLGLARYWSTNYQQYFALMTAESVLGGGTFSSALILSLELVGAKYRAYGGAFVLTSFSLGQSLLGFGAWLVPYWRNLILLLYIPQFIAIIYFWTMSESVRWCLSKGRFSEAESLLKKAARMNGAQLSQKSLDDLQTAVEEERNMKVGNDLNLLTILWRVDKQIIIRLVVGSVWYITITMIYYGLSINSVNLTGNKYLNYVLVSMVELPGFWTVVFVCNRIGRKPTLIIGFWLCAACQAGFILIPEHMVTTALSVYFMGKLAIAFVLPALNIYLMELLPTQYRHQLYSVCATVGRVGAIVAPLTPALGATYFAQLPFVLFGSFALLSGIMTFFVPETLGSALPDTMDEAINIGKNDL